MGRRIDRIAGGLVLFLAAFAFFLFAWRNLYIALLAAGLFLFFAKKIAMVADDRFGSRRKGRAKRKKLAEEKALKWVFQAEEIALDEAARILLATNGYTADDLTDRRFIKKSREVCQFALIQNHPEGAKTDGNAVLRYWKAHAECDTLILLNTGFFDEKARAIVESLTKPGMRLIDRDELVQLICQSKLDIHAEEQPMRQKKGARIRQILRQIMAISRKAIWRNALYGALLMILYFLIGIKTYLVVSLVLLGLAAVGLRRPKPKAVAL